MSAVGQPDYANNYETDGMDNNERMIGTIGVQPSIDAIQEVDVQTNNYKANATRTAGAVVNVITKSGTNNVHGSLYEFLRNDMFDAKDYFNVPQAGNPLAGTKPKYRQNQFGGSIGGPIRKNKTFFFGDWEELRIVQGITSSTPVPSPCELGATSCNGYQGLGNFSDLLPNTIVYDPLTHQPYDYNGHPNVMPPTAIDAISRNYAALFPTNATCPTPTTCAFSDAPNRTQKADTFDIRVDQHFTPQTYLYSRYTFNNENTFTPGALPAVNVAGLTGVQPGGDPGTYSFPGPNRERAQNLALTLTHTFSPNVVGQLTASFTRINILSLPLNFGVNVNNAFGGPAVNTNGLINGAGTGLAYASISGYTYLGSDEYVPLQYLENTFQYGGNIIVTHGNHTISFGAGLIRRQGVLAQSATPLGAYSFSGLLTNSTEGGPGGSGGNSFAQFLSGYTDSQDRNLQLKAAQGRTWEPHAYIEDDWRTTPWLTLNLGVRYDIFTPFTSKHNYMSNFDPSVPSMLNGGRLIIAGQDGLSASGGVVTDLKDFAPRVGFAATMPHTVVLRGGFGMSFFPDNFFTPVMLPNQPFNSITTIPTQFGQPVGYTPPRFGESLGPAVPTSVCLTNACEIAMTGSPFPSGTVTQVGSGEAFNFHNAYAYQYNLELQKQFGAYAVSIGYVGSLDRRLRTSGSPDTPLPPQGPGGCGATTRISLPNPCQPLYAELPLTSRVRDVSSQGVSMYNGLQVDFKHPAGHGLTFDTNYIYGRALADVGESGGGAGGVYGLIPSNFLYDWGNNQLDIRHRWTLSLAYALPFGKSLTGFAGEAAKGWSINTLTIWTSGLPVTVSNSADPQINIGGGSDRPDMISKNLYPNNRGLKEWFNIAAFARQPFGTAGNEKNNQIYGPSAKSVGFSVFKDFPIQERATLQFRAEMFNLFNTPNFASPNTSIHGFDSSEVPTSAGRFGQITSTNINFPARQIQFALKLLF